VSHDHDHGVAIAPGAPPAERRRRQRALALVLALLIAFAVVEVVGGVISGSLALIADAGHMVSDALAVALALGAAWVAGRPAGRRASYGYGRAEILAALVNGAALVGISVWVLIEALGRLVHPNEVEGGIVLVVGGIGALVNVVAAVILFRSGTESLNVRAAFLHVLGDLAGSIAVLASAAIVLTTGFERADPIVAIVISVLIAASAVPTLREATSVLLEATPPEVDVERVGGLIASTPGVVDVHDVHVWTITSGFPALTAHVLVSPEVDCHEARRAIEHALQEDFDLTHTTLQVDHGTGPRAFVPVEQVRRAGAATDDRRGDPPPTA
jgi:cobalt-zinc-cadmium efflux system protein